MRVFHPDLEQGGNTNVLPRRDLANRRHARHLVKAGAVQNAPAANLPST
jgi:hypothetical protein